MPATQNSPFLISSTGLSVFEDYNAFWQAMEKAVRLDHEVFAHVPLLRLLFAGLGRKISGWSFLVFFNQPDRPISSLLRRARDIGLSFIALAIFSPLLVLVSILIKKESPGPVFYKTTVVGRGAKPFVWRKFRSMRVVHEQDNIAQRREQFKDYVLNYETSKTVNPVPSNKIVDYSRITSVGRIIRKYSIDELPQLYNVLNGEMSLVGPRPCLPYEAEFRTDWRRRRFQVLPGLSGIWQVFGRGQVTFDENAAMDVYYIYRQSFRFDLYLIVRTLWMVVTAKGAV